MFRKFDSRTDISSTSQVKSSVQRGIKAKILEQYPALADRMDDLFPKKEPLLLVKCHDHIVMIECQGQLLFFQQRDGPYFPLLKTLHRYPDILIHQQVDKGAIKFVLSGANIMCPGLTSKGAKMVDSEENTIVAVMAEGKEHACAIGIMKMSNVDIASKNKGIGIETIHFINDGLWHTKGTN